MTHQEQERGKKYIAEVPLTPNFLRWFDSTRPIATFTDKELRAIGKEWTANLLAKAALRRKQRKLS